MKKLVQKKFVICTLIVFLVLIGCIYIGGYTYYKERFFVNTTINGINISRKTKQEVLDIYHKKGNAYNLLITENNTELLNITGKDICLKYEIESSIKDLFSKQKTHLWWKAYFQQSNKTFPESISYDSNKVITLLNEYILITDSNRTAPKSAEIVFDGEHFVIQKEQSGTQIDTEKLQQLTLERISNLNQAKLEITAENCYLQPAFTEQSPEVIQACQEMNGYCDAQITYKFSSSYKETIGKDKIAEWVTVNPEWKTGINQDAVQAFLNSLAATYRGQIDVAKELPLLISNIQNHEITERVPIPEPPKFSRKIYENGTYIEVDLTNQHMWYVENGRVVLECDVVTGLPTNERSTPAGQYRITEKLRNKILTGNIDPATGEPEYRTKVSYWMRITNSGIGFHDATWQTSFGGNRYKSHGSHGCINMSYNTAQKLYNMVSVGTRTIIHY